MFRKLSPADGSACRQMRTAPDAIGYVTAVLMLLIATFGSAACGGGFGTRAIPWPENLSASPSPASQGQSIESSNDLVFYLDGSMSMKGYLQSRVPARGSGAPSSGATIYSRALERIHDVATRPQAGTKVHVRRVDSRVGVLEQGLALERAVTSAAYYSGSDTNLVAAIAEFPKPLTPTPVGPVGSVTPAPPALFHILVTDGVQSDRGGVDPTRFKDSLKGLLESGWAGYILGVRSQFAGSIWSENRPGTKIEWETGDDASRFRPFYILVLSPDPTRLATFAEELRTEIEQVTSSAVGSAAATPSLVREIHLGGEFVSGQPEGNLAVEDASSRLLRPAPTEQNPVRLTLWVDPALDRHGPQDFTVSFDKVQWTRYAMDCLSKDETGNIVDMTVTQVELQGDAERHRHPALSLSGPPVIGADSLAVKLKVDWTAGSGSPEWGIYRLDVRVTNEKLKTMPVPKWVADWSTDDDSMSDTEHCTKTYKLTRALDAVWSLAKPESRTLAVGFLRVGPR